MDGDFSLPALLADDRLAASAPEAPPVAGLAKAALAAQVWRLPAAVPATADEVITPPAADLRLLRADLPIWPDMPAETRLLHSFETGPVLRPPVADHCGALTATRARTWLALAAHWISLARSAGDLRFFNTACKLLGAVHASPVGACAQIRAEVTLVAQLVNRATADLAARLASQFQSSRDREVPYDAPRPPQPVTTLAGTRRERIVLLASSRSGTALRLATMSPVVGVRIAEICWFRPPTGGDDPSSYDDAWYPSESHQAAPLPPAVNTAQVIARDWEQVSGHLRRLRPDLVILAGMPIVPAELLCLARLGMINAHNGALPGYRGMDAVAWAILGNDPITCTLHLAEPGPDRGAVLSTVTVAFAPAGTLRARVKEAQTRLLLAAAAHLSATGSLPAATAQPAGQGRQFYRLHPHLKRILDNSPYRAITTSTAGGNQP